LFCQPPADNGKKMRERERERERERRRERLGKQFRGGRESRKFEQSVSQLLIYVFTCFLRWGLIVSPRLVLNTSFLSLLSIWAFRTFFCVIEVLGLYIYRVLCAVWIFVHYATITPS
jgi:hypothetical protein